MGSVMRDLLHRITHRNRREDSLIGSEDDENLSRHSSIRGPYRDGIKDNTFPIYHTVNTSMQGGDVYARSFFRLGNGLGLLDKIGNLNRPKMHFDNGSLIGDLGTIDEEGCFNHCCNIFFPANHSVHVALPQDFVPFHPPLSDDDCIVTPNVFEPGTILTSEGVDISQVPNSKWKTEFKTSAREGAVLVLPTGASREELADPSKLYPYIKEHATSWYQFYNQNSDHIASAYIPNGTLYLVIGVDRATSWSTATFPLGSEDTAKQRQFIYNGDTPLTPWSNSKCFSAFESNFLKDETQSYVEPDNVKYYSSLSDLGRRTRLHYSLPRLSHLPKRTYFPEVLFHPSLPLAHILTLTV
ncbi:hypothetical protein BDN70DRAFT_248559 [Pholiota conissans]|uniref:Uncharacterized protein n=1 Tax=Pholiota conissans TaxID=109636 RepID=A0A9P5YUU1_9AGAR|nr:hypothetical protein BDN70DRAFT_248559 [Pholiota conissans]